MKNFRWLPWNPIIFSCFKRNSGAVSSNYSGSQNSIKGRRYCFSLWCFLTTFLMPFKYYSIFSYIFATFCFHTTAFSTQVQRKINPYNLIYTFTVGIEHPSQPVPHRCISLWRKSRQCMSADYPLPSHKDHISVTLQWKYYCLKYFTPGFTHISPVLCPCIIEKTTSFIEQQAT